MLYFAYGSNMHWPQMKQRCPSAEYVTRARLEGHRLDFTLLSPPAARNGGVADVVPDPAAEVWGVIYDIGDPHDWLRLDRFEGLRTGREGLDLYQRRELKVRPHPQPENGLTLTVQLYQVRQRAERTIPLHPDYKALLVTGARHWDLPADYIEHLEALPVSSQS